MNGIMERYHLTIDRIETIQTELTVGDLYQEYFQSISQFILAVNHVLDLVNNNQWNDLSVEDKQKYNHEMYQDILPSNYNKSYANPSLCSAKFGQNIGAVLSLLYYEMRALIAYAFEKDYEGITICNELFIQIYNQFEQEVLDEEELKDIIYWYASDYCDVFLPKFMESQFNPEKNIACNIINSATRDSVSYLYNYGEYVTDIQIETAKHLSTLAEEELKEMARVIVDGFRTGFINTGKDISKKSVVNVHYILGFELLIKEVIKEFNQCGLLVAFYRSPVSVITKRKHHKSGYYGAIANPQYEYDHKDDSGLFLDKKYLERKLQVSQNTYQQFKELAATFAGPAVLETFGQPPFAPETNIDAISLSEKQQELGIIYGSKMTALSNQFIKPEERSYTIIAFPTPDIGGDYPQIFDDILKVNTLDAKLYETVQQTIIDTLDQGEYVTITGSGDNKTKLRVQLTKLNNPEKETGFENCVADVNIPVGEVFTSPVLEGTTGTLHVSKVYLNELLYENLEIQFENGKTTQYTCSNFTNEEENRNYIKQNLLFNRTWLPMGEFAIGTNTTAYAVAKRHNIHDKLPILIAEKMGPHFAIGDTCYSWSEDIKVYNPNGKEIVAKHNEISRLRDTDPGNAYFQCHTDITIPYEEIEEIAVHHKEGSKTLIIKDGRFSLPGTTVLNVALEGAVIKD